MLQVHVRRSGGGVPGHLIILAVLIVVLIVAVAWGIRHRPTRPLESSPPPTLAVEASPGVGRPAETPAPAPTPTLGPNDVMVYTLDGQTVCSGYPVGDLGYRLRCALPADVRLFRVVDAGGNSTLTIRYTDQVVVRVGPK